MAPLYEERSMRRMRFLQKITAKTKIQPKKLIMRSIISINFFLNLQKFYRKSQIAKTNPWPKKSPGKICRQSNVPHQISNLQQ